MVPLAFAVLLAAATPASSGELLYTTNCASCHGIDRAGTPNGPTLRGVGLASVDFFLITGRMPAAVPHLEVGDRGRRIGERLPLDQIRALEAYLAPVVAGGPPIPHVAASGDTQRGRRLYALHCQQCHAVQGTGGDLGGLDWAPALRGVTIGAVADAIRAGPGEMPQFGEHQVPDSDLDDLAAYVMQLQTAGQPRVVPPFRSTGPVPEGAIGYLAIVVLVAFVFIFWRSDTPAPHREESVRRDEGQKPG